MSKIFAGELIGEEIAAASIGAEMASGVGIPLAFMEIGVLGMIHGIRHHKKKKEDQRNRAAEEQKQREEEEYQRQLAEERERQRQEQIQADEQRRIQEEQQAEIRRQEEERQRQIDAAVQQREVENQQNVQRVVDRNQQIEDQLLQERRDRLRGESVFINGYREQPGFLERTLFAPSMGMYEERPEEWRLISGNYIPGYPDYPGGDGGPNGGGGGGGFPNNDPSGNNFNQQGNRPNGNRGRISNPYTEVISRISQQIAQNINREKPAPQPEEKKDDTTEEQNQPIIGGNPATWSPTGKNIDPNQPDINGNYPGKNGGGIYKGPDIGVPNYIKNNDDVHLIENELLQIINAQGISQIGQEQTEVIQAKQLQELGHLETQVDQILHQQVQIDPASIFTSAISMF